MSGQAAGNLGDSDDFGGDQRDPAHDAAQFARIAAPVVAVQQIECVRCDVDPGARHGVARLVEKAPGKETDILASVTQRRYFNHILGETVKQVFAEAGGLDALFERFVARGDDADVDADRRGASDSIDDALFKRPQQRLLGHVRQGGGKTG